MKTIGIIGAVEEIIETIKEKSSVVTIKKMLGSDFYLAKLGNNSIVIVKSGYGKVNAAVSTQVMIDMFAVDYIINVGIAFSRDKSINSGDIVISKSAFYYDFDFTSVDYAAGDVTEIAESAFAADEALMDIAKNFAENNKKEHTAHIGTVATGDGIVSYEVKADCIDLTGAAVAHTCYLNKIPFVLIKLISDSTDRLITNESGRAMIAEIAENIVLEM